MTNRKVLCEAIISQAGWDKAEREPLAGDASRRRYERLTDPQSGKTAVLMDAAPEVGENVERFVDIAEILQGIGLSAPEIFAQDTQHGFLLLEDLGDDLFARLLERQPELERELYSAATDVLVALREAEAPWLDSFGPTRMAEACGLAFTAYTDVLRDPDPDMAERFEARFEDILHRTTQGPRVLMLRDYHAENLVWLPEREGNARVGLLDFQDAMLAHPAYDLVSLLQDIRRKVPAGIEMRMIDRYIRATSSDDHAFRTAYAVLGVQRNLRILGVFSRLGSEYGKPRYLSMLPAVWDHVMRGLDHPALVPVADILREALPKPTPEVLDQLRDAR
ncbi:aminoglycoside phosphotransferase family protein [Lutimaribacter marinistellae]|uniref:Aminoglycoside phosphotransferase family protein n=1 Tax=Lutimaribacter marinistellae TaxID=1820329 RepID=A0ABV7TES7_9RHOB